MLFVVVVDSWLSPPGLLQHFTPLVLADSQKRRSAPLPSQPLQPLVALYNSVLAHLKAQAQHPVLQTLQWPLPEFAPHLSFSRGSLPPLSWNSSAYLEQVSLALSRLSMPSCHKGGSLDPQQKEEWSQQWARCMAFVGELSIGEGNQQVTIPLLSR